MICAGDSEPLLIDIMMILTEMPPKGTLTALTAKLPRQPLTSHPSVKGHLEKGMNTDTRGLLLQ